MSQEIQKAQGNRYFLTSIKQKPLKAASNQLGGKLQPGGCYSGEAASHRQVGEMPDLPVGKQRNQQVRATVTTNNTIMSSVPRATSVGVANNDLASAAASIGNGLQASSSHQRNEFAGFQRHLRNQNKFSTKQIENKQADHEQRGSFDAAAKQIQLQQRMMKTSG